LEGEGGQDGSGEHRTESKRREVGSWQEDKKKRVGKRDETTKKRNVNSKRVKIGSKSFGGRGKIPSRTLKKRKIQILLGTGKLRGGGKNYKKIKEKGKKREEKGENNLRARQSKRMGPDGPKVRGKG